MNDNSPNKLTIIIVGVLALLMIAILPIAPALFRSTAPTLTFSPLRVDDPLTQLSGDSIEQLFERDTIADLTLTLDTPIVELNNHPLREVFDGNSILEDEQLLTNGHFSDGTTGLKTFSANTSVTNNVLTFTATAQFGQTYFIVEYINGNKYYYNEKIKSSTKKNIRFFANGVIMFLTTTTDLTNYEILSGIFTSNQTSKLGEYRIVRDNDVSDFQPAYVDYAYLFNISTLIANKQYSPLYATSFDLMIDEQIKAQMDAFVDKPYEFMNYDLLGWYPTQSELDFYYSLYQELINLDVDLTAQYSNGIYTNDEVIIYVTPLITAGQYSPLFDSTFDVMTDADIEDQLDDWLVRGFNYPQLTYELTEAQLLYFTTLNQELIDRDGGLPNTITYEIFTSGNLIYDLVPLKTNHQYSPLYMKTFDVMSDAEIIAQMNAWQYENLLP